MKILRATTIWRASFVVVCVAIAGLVACASDAEPEATADPVEFDVELGEFFIRPDRVEVPAGAPVVHVTNTGAIEHDLHWGEQGTEVLKSGESETVTFGPFAENARLICSIPGHEDAGMHMEVVVQGATPGEPQDDHGAAADGAQIDPNAEPPEGWEPRDPALSPAGEETVHRITLEATETVLEVAPGVTQEVWTFNDLVPGPILRGRVGDTFEVTLVNKGTIGHSIDFHASKVAWNDEMRTIEPGESLVYRFEAKHAGIFMYHCGTAPTLHHIGNGMYGAIIIDPPELEPVDHEFVFVQSEFYLGPEGQPGDLKKMQRDAWDAVVFNGYFNQYLHAPIRIEPDERVRAWLLNAGPSENSSFHIVGTIFDTVYKEGAWWLRRDATQGGAQALDLQPAQGGFVEFTMDEAGLYPIVTHKFSNVGKGALGLFQAGEVEDTDASH
jgi:nitrite reductase (NO-forming)